MLVRKRLRDFNGTETKGSRNALYPSQKAHIWHQPLDKGLYGKYCESSFTPGVPKGNIP